MVWCVVLSHHVAHVVYVMLCVCRVHVAARWRVCGTSGACGPHPALVAYVAVSQMAQRAAFVSAVGAGQPSVGDVGQLSVS